MPATQTRAAVRLTGETVTRLLSLETGSDLPAGWAAIRVRDEDGTELATTVRFKMAGDRIAADLPGCDASVVVTDSNGSITDG